MTNDIALGARGLCKSFGGVSVLRDIDLDFRSGEVHAILGENGAGKSTLIKILSGYHRPDRGSIEVRGKPVELRNPRDALDASIHTIYQELTLCPTMSVAENIVMGEVSRSRGLFQRGADYERAAAEALKRLGQDEIDPRCQVGELSLAKQQVVEIAKAMHSRARILLMDEPTSSISQEDADKLFALIGLLKADGVTIVYISHRLHEIRSIADRVTILRDGELVRTVGTSDVSDEELVSMMVGRELANAYPKRAVPLGEVVLKVEGLGGGRAFRGLSFDVRRGEIFGIGGLVGAGRTEVLETLFGLRPATSGKLWLKGEEYLPSGPREAIRRKIAFITEDRKRSGLVLCLPVLENINAVGVQRRSPFGWIDWKRLRETAERQRRAMSIKLNDVDQVVSTLSGGNQQKVVLGKWLDMRPDVVLFDEPTRGIDVGAKTEIYSIMGRLAEEGAAIVMVSSELPELLSISDRIMVMREGECRGIVGRAEATQEGVMALAALDPARSPSGGNAARETSNPGRAR